MPLSRLLPLIVLLLAGCAARVPWQHPELPKDQWSRDWSSCRKQAEREVVGYRSDDSYSGPLGDYDRNQDRRRIDAYSGMCMRDLGYIPAKKGG